MGKCIFRDGTVIEDYGRPYIVSEVNSSHNGNIDVAKKMIDVSSDIGCDCVKFQSWTEKTLYSETYYKANPIAKRFIDRFSLSAEQLKELSEYCSKKKISFASTPYSKEEVDFLVERCNVPYVKIASMEINNPNFLKYIGTKKVPIVLSTGMSTIEEVRDAVKLLESVGATQIVILHCVSIYPTELTTVNLNNICGLRKEFPKYPIGFSDHTEGDAASIAATALGAALIEKHLTLDRSKVGMDNGMATEPDIFNKLVESCRNIQIAMGSMERSLSTKELNQRLNMRRSIVSTHNIMKGEVISENDIDYKRPGTGISPDKVNRVLGKRARVNIDADELIMLDEIQ